MPISTSQIKARLEKTKSIEDLPDGDRQRMIKILEMIGDQKIHVRGLLGKITKNRVEIGNRYLLAALDWLCTRGYLSKVPKKRRKELKLTNEGNEALLKLHAFFSPPQNEFEFRLDIGGEYSVKVTPFHEGDPKIDSAFPGFVISSFRQALLGFSTHIIASGWKGAPDKWIFESEGKRFQRKFATFLGQLWLNCLKIAGRNMFVTNEFLNLNCAFMSFFQMDLYPEELARYRNYWRKVEKEARANVGSDKEINFRKILPWALKGDLSDPDIRQWIDKKLDEDPDWYMPHFLWNQLGFKRRKNLNEPSSANPPSFLTIHPKSLDTMIKLGWTLEDVGLFLKPQTPPKKVAKIFRTLSEAVKSTIFDFFSTNQKSADLYDAWHHIRSEYTKKMPEVSKVLDGASMQYIFAGKKPVVNLVSAFRDIVDGLRSPGEVERLVRERYYKLED